MIFDRQAVFYDALYQDKDYEADCDLLEQVFAAFAHRPINTILDLGCGTGGHVMPLAERGYAVTGVDRSEPMLAEARRKVVEKAGDEWPATEFFVGDIQDLHLATTFDAVVALFAVISYQTSNEGLLASMRTARRHLEAGGLFVFDGWSGPGVLTQKPSDRHKIVEKDGERIIRFPSSILDILQHTVRVQYKMLRLKHDQVMEEIDESHHIRFLFPQEIAHFLDETGFKLLRLCPQTSIDRELSMHEWSFTAIAEAI